MEPGIKEFFKRLVTSIALLVLWLMINVTVGIKFNLGFYDDAIQWSNIAFYAWLAVSFTALMWVYKKIWKKPIDNLHDKHNA